jgi:hypothetical protein
MLTYSIRNGFGTHFVLATGKLWDREMGIDEDSTEMVNNLYFFQQLFYIQL